MARDRILKVLMRDTSCHWLHRDSPLLSGDLPPSERERDTRFGAPLLANQQEWGEKIVEISGVGLRYGKLSEGPVVLSSPFDCLSLHLPSPSQYVFSLAP